MGRDVSEESDAILSYEFDDLCLMCCVENRWKGKFFLRVYQKNIFRKKQIYDGSNNSLFEMFHKTNYTASLQSF